MAMYTLENSGSDKDLEFTERDIYGSSRLGLEGISQIIASTNSANINIDTNQRRTVGDKNYELTNHLGNVLEVVTDRKLPESTSTVTEVITPTLTDLSGVSVTTGVITRTVAGSSWGPSGGSSVETVGPNDFFEWTLGGTSYLDNSYIMCGLSYTNPDNNYTTMKYGWYTWVGGAGGLTIFESGVCVSGTYGSYGPFAPGGVLKVARENGYIKYYYNGVLKRTVVDANPTADMIVDFTIGEIGRSIYGLKVQTQTQIEAYKPDVIQYSDYYPFGMQMPSRTFTPTSSYLYGFNGKLMDDEVHNLKGTSYDFGARMYDPRVGRWLTLDPLAIKYPDKSPYHFAGNSPVSSYDPDGKYIIFINGEVGQFGPVGENKAVDRANVKYWSKTFVNKVVNALSFYQESKEKYKFLDGDVGTTPSTRSNAGCMQAKLDFETVIAQLKKDESGKITETVKLISHSKGAAYSVGYMEQWNKMVRSDEYKDKFADGGGLIEFNLMLAPHQSGYLAVQNSNEVYTPTIVTITHDWDILSDNDVQGGNAVNISTDNNAWSWQTTKAHTIDGFHFEAEAACKNFATSKEGFYSNSFNTDVTKASKDIFNRTTGKYDEND